MNIGRFFDIKVNMMQDKAYQNIDADKEDPADEPIDAAGFTGQMSRQTR